MGRPVKDLRGLTAGYLVAQSFASSDGKRVKWNVLCTACGREIQMPGQELQRMARKGIKASCGCRKAQTIGEKNRIHGMSRHPAFGVWHSMKERCESPTHKAYKNYGARGITVCERWSRSFENFWEDMGGTWKKGLTLDRIDNSKGYFPENCRWVGYRTQANNRRNTPLVDGKPLTEWSRETGICLTTLHYRLAHGCPREKLFVRPDVRNRFTTSQTADQGTALPSSQKVVP